MKNAIIDQYDAYNQRRYSTPWVCKMSDNGMYDFNTRVGCYTGDGRNGGAGDLVVFNPQTGVVYGYGQKDYRGNNTQKMFSKWDGEKFVKCDKLGRQKQEEN